MTQNLSAGEHSPHIAASTPERHDHQPECDSSSAPEQKPACNVRITSPASLLATVPSLLGFHPGNSMVLVGTVPPRGQIRLTLRYDLPDPPDSELAAQLAWHATGVLGAQHIETVSAVGYGSGHLVTPVADALRECALQTGLRVTELLRVEGHRYWSYVCADSACCSPDGTPFEISDHPAAVAMAAAGAQVLSSREELAATVMPREGKAAELMRVATRRAEERAERLVARVARSGSRGSARRLIAVSGLEAVAAAIAAYRHGERLPAGDGAAWLTVVLRDLRVRDDAWSRMDPRFREEHLRLWTDLTRLAQPGYVSAPASLLAFVGWQSGNGALANVALDRAMEDDPDYSMARLLRQAVDSGAPPSMARLPMTPEEVAASYDDLEELDTDNSTADSAPMVDPPEGSGCAPSPRS